jgi:pyruvate kinase
VRQALGACHQPRLTHAPWLLAAPPAPAPAAPHSYQKLAHDVKPGSSILCADGSIVLEVISTNPAAGTVRARCKNTAMLG